MKRIWTRAAAAAAPCAVLLSGCSFSSEILSDHSVPADPLTGQALQYPGERATAVVIDNAPASTVQWGIGSASVVLEAQTDWTRDAIFEACKTLAEQMEKKNGWLLFPLGIALSGKARTPGGGTDLAAMMGREETLKRVKDALGKL